MSTFSLLNCDSHSRLTLCGPLPHSIWVTPLCEHPLHSTLALIPLSRLPFPRDGIFILLSLRHPAWTVPTMWAPFAQAVTPTLSPPPTCRWSFDLTRALTLPAGQRPLPYSPIFLTGLPILCCMDALLTLLSHHLHTVDCPFLCRCSTHLTSPGLQHPTEGHSGPSPPLTWTPSLFWPT